MRTCSPLAMYKSTKDPRNHLLWQPNEKSLQNLEVDEAGKLAAFRSRFGHGWDAEVAADEGEEAVAAADAPAKTADAGAAAEKDKKTDAPPAASKSAGSHDALADLIAGYAVGMPELPEQEHRKKKK
jgi:hypothetical protein